MKRFAFLSFVALLSVLLSGCGSIHANYREVEQLRIIQTLGLDRSPGGVRVTLAASADRSGDAPLCFDGLGESVSSAIDNARIRSVEEDLFTGHLKHILIGEEAARQSVEPYLSFICRSPDGRMDMPLFILHGAAAREAMTAVGNGEKGVSELLQAAHAKQGARSGGHVFTAAEILRQLDRQDCALACALRYGPAAEAKGSSPGAGESSGGGEGAGSQESPDAAEEGSADTGQEGGKTQEESGRAQEEGFRTAALDGYAIIRGGKVVDYIDRETALGADFLLNTVGIQDLVIRDRFGSPVTLEINSGSTRIHPLWAPDGSLRGIEIYAKVKASVLETGSAGLSAAENADELTGQLESAVSERIGAVLWRARTLQADFLGLADRVEQATPLEYRRQEQPLGPLLPALELSIAVQGELSHSHDLD